MEGVQRTAVDGGAEAAAYYPVRSMAPAVIDIQERRLDELQTLVITKTRAGFDRTSVDRLRQIIDQAGAGLLGPLKFITFEFAHEETPPLPAPDGFHELIDELADLILRAPIVSVACARGHMEGADLEFALACSMLIGEDGASFSFAGDPVDAIGVYGFLAQKLGFVRAERLMEGGERLDAEQMQALLLLKDVAVRGGGPAAMEQFLRRTARRHNSCYGIYRAQRIASPRLRDAS